MSHKAMTLTTITPGVGSSVKGEKDDPRMKNIIHRVRFNIVQTGVVLVSAAKIQIQGSPDNSGGPALVPVDGDGPVISAGLGEGSTPADGKIANGLFYYRIGGVNKTKEADAVGVAFTAVHKVALDKFGAINVYINAAGTISTWIDSAAQTDELAHDTALAALDEAQSDAFPHPADNVLIGTILIGADGTQWVANTDDLTDASDLDTATFLNTTSSFSLLYEYTLTAPNIAAQKGVFYIADIPDSFKRLFLSEITGDGQFEITADSHIVSLPG